MENRQRHIRRAGTLNGTTLTIDWGQPDPVIYQVMNDGTLEGTWAKEGKKASLGIVTRTFNTHELIRGCFWRCLMNSVSAPTVLTASASLSYEHIAAFQHSFRTNPAYRIAQNAVTQTSVDDIALNRDIVTAVDHSFSTILDTWSVTQKKSGRCWMFAGLNLFRPGAMARMNLKNFEFSQGIYCSGINSKRPITSWGNPRNRRPTG